MHVACLKNGRVKSARDGNHCDNHFKRNRQQNSSPFTFPHTHTQQPNLWFSLASTCSEFLVWLFCSSLLKIDFYPFAIRFLNFYSGAVEELYLHSGEFMAIFESRYESNLTTEILLFLQDVHEASKKARNLSTLQLVISTPHSHQLGARTKSNFPIEEQNKSHSNIIITFLMPISQL
jgi:hypothetical protein